MTLGNIPANGVRSLDVWCWQCHHRALERWPNSDRRAGAGAWRSGVPCSQLAKKKSPDTQGLFGAIPQRGGGGMQNGTALWQLNASLDQMFRGRPVFFRMVETCPARRAGQASPNGRPAGIFPPICRALARLRREARCVALLHRRDRYCLNSGYDAALRYVKPGLGAVAALPLLSRAAARGTCAAGQAKCGRSAYL
jgi:hypothetical protein